VGGEECLHLSNDADADISKLHWCRAHTNPNTGRLWVSLHSANDAWVSSINTVKVVAVSGAVLLDASSVSLASAPPITLSYLTTINSGTRAILHAHSASDSPATITSLTVDGVIQVPLPPGGLTLPSGGHAAFVVELPPPHSRATGDVWTAELTISASGSYDGGSATAHKASTGGRGATPNSDDDRTSASTDATNNTDHIAMVVTTAGFGGRTAPERFPIESWPSSHDCSLPMGNTSNAAEVQKLGVDSQFWGFGNWNSQCPTKFATLLADLSNATTPEGWARHLCTDCIVRTASACQTSVLFQACATCMPFHAPSPVSNSLLGW
jgi:hypothetical protein